MARRGPTLPAPGWPCGAAAPESTSRVRRRPSPPGHVIGVEKGIILGDPDMAHVSTSYVERQNLTMRMSMRRFTRLTNGFSKKFENHCHAVALHMFYYNFIRVHQTIKTTPAKAAGVTDRAWTMLDVVGLIESAECEGARTATAT
jgi:hypothetical protein